MNYRCNHNIEFYKRSLPLIRQNWLLVLFLLLFGMLSVKTFAQPAPVTTESPYLRIEAGQHTAMINRIALNQENNLLLTVSDDKTARLWNLPGGELKGVMRVPIGDGLEGSLYAGALSPDGKIAILAGDISNKEETFALYLYDTATLRMKNRLAKLPSEILHLAYTPDGEKFAAAFGSGHGVVVWDSNQGKKVAEDFDYGSSCNWINFAKDGRMVTSSDDGFIRIYDAQIQLLQKVKGRGGQQPYGVAFSDDGRLIAVGYKDKVAVDVIDASNGKIIKSPTSNGLTGESLSSVAWFNGDLLAAGGAGKGDKRVIRRWAQKTGKPTDIPVAQNTITSLATLADGNWLYATAEPSWGIINPQGRSIVRHDRPVTDFRGIFHRNFAISADGLVATWQINSKQVAQFDLAQQILTLDPAPNTALSKPMTSAAELPVMQWENTTAPTFKNQPLNLGRNESSRSLAMLPDKSGFILGTDHYLRWFDASGAELVNLDIPAPAYGVNISGDGRYLMAALANGTLYWYRLHPTSANNPARIEEYAGLFLSVDGARWIAWTKEGFFAHSMQGGKNLAGYHLNRGNNKNPEWIDFGQLYQSFYSPSVLKRKMLGGDEQALQAELAQAQEVVNGLFANPVPEVELTEYCLLDKATATTRAFRRTEATTATTSAATASNAANKADNVECTPIGKTTRGFARTQSPNTKEANAPVQVAQEEPVLQRIELPAGKELVRLRFKLKERSGGVSDIQLLRNGVVIDSANAKTRGFSRVSNAPAANQATATSAAPTPNKENAIAAKDGEVILERDLQLEPGTNRLQVRAYDSRNRANGKSSLIEMVVPTAVAPTETVAARGEDKTQQQPMLYVLSVGVDKYLEKHNELKFAVKDAKAVADLLEEKFSNDFAKSIVMRLYDEQATRNNIEKAFDDLTNQLAARNREDTVVVYLAGHGMNEKNNYYFISQNARSNDFTETAISQQWLAGKLGKLSEYAKNVLIFLDSCHSGAYDPRSSESISKARDSFGELLMIAGASAQELAQDAYIRNGQNTDHGVFGYAVSTGLSGVNGGEEALNRHKKVTALRLVTFVTAEMEEIAKNPQYSKQHPVSMPAGNNLSKLEFPLTAIK